ncbi:MAG: MFS transporter [Defluviitaleaceae bacterium]|nr:MFS transporter [Defluviitaleaceae bacterium]MCL2835170.1 MFS transporter [Defluviitaleaceae bacterium]
MGKNRKIDGIMVFLIISAFTGLAMGLSDSILSNYFREAYNATAQDRGFIEFPREMPGVISLLLIASLAFLKNVKTAIIAMLLAAAGMTVLGLWRPSFGVMLIFIFIYSLGTHMNMPVRDSIGLSLVKDRGMGRMMGRFNSMSMAFSMLAGLIIFFGFRFGFFDFGVPVAVFLLSAACFILAAVFFGILRKVDPAPEKDAPVNARFIFRKEYIRYYIICAFFGGRKQIMIVYSPWVLIELLGFRADSMSILAVIGAFIGIFFVPIVGRWIDRYGVRKVMMIEALAFIGVYIAYGLLSRWVGARAVSLAGPAMLLVYLLNIVDRMTAQFGMDRAIYMRQIALRPEDVTPSLSLGMSIDHILAIAGSAVCGMIWVNFGPEYVFILAGLMSAANFVVAKGIKIR